MRRLELLRRIAAESSKEIRKKETMKLSAIRKALVAAASNATTLIVAFVAVFPSVPNQAATVLTAVSTVLVGVVTYLTRNDVVDVVDRY
jgi:threonine/homoserine/homoserine lactone efflux protein